MIRAVTYFLKQGFRNLFQGHKLMSLASCAIVAASLMLLGIFQIVCINTSAAMESLGKQCEINVYLSREPGGNSLSKIETDLKAIPGVQEVRFVSKSDRLRHAKETTYAGREYMLEDLEKDNPIRDSYILTVEELGQSGSVAGQARQIQGVEEVQNSQELIDRIRTISNTVRTAGVWIMIILVLVAMFIISNTIRIGLISRNEEIAIMRIVGASDSYICGPFMAEGAMVGFFGAFIAALVTLVCYAFLKNAADSMSALLGAFLLPVSRICLPVLLSYFGIGIGIGLLGSGISVRRYMRS